MTALRIASLLASATEMLYGLGLGERVVAVSHECDYPPEAMAKPRVTRTRLDAAAPSGEIDRQVGAMLQAGQPLYEIDAAMLVQLEPDLIVTQAQCDVCAVRYQDVVDLAAQQPALRRTHITALNPQSLPDVLADIERVAAAAGVPQAGTHYVARLRERISAVRRTAQGLPEEQRPRVAAIEWLEPLMAAGNWTPELIDWAGGQSHLAPAGQHSPYIAWETIRKYNPQVMVLMPCGFDLPRTQKEAQGLARMPGWGELAAVRAGRVWAVDGNAYFNRSGPRLVDSLELLARLFHPQLFVLPAHLVPGVQFARLR